MRCQSFPELFDAFPVENERVHIRTILLTPFASAALSLMVAALMWLLPPIVIGRPFSGWQILATVIITMILLESWRWRQKRETRQQLERLRDSALW
jgi:uncharacterized protein YjiS (DUF1127 family)